MLSIPLPNLWRSDCPELTPSDAEGMVAAWLEWLRMERRASSRTIEHYGRDLRRFLAFLNDRECISVSKDHIAAFTAADAANGRSPRSIVRQMSSLRSYFHCRAMTGNATTAVETYRVKIPAPTQAVPADTALDRAIRAARGNAPLEWVGHRDQALFFLMLDCGLSLGEALALRRQDAQPQGASENRRRLELPPRAMIAMTNYLRTCPHTVPEDGPLFVGIRGRVLNPGVAQRQFRLLRPLAGLPDDATPHVLRKSFRRKQPK